MNNLAIALAWVFGAAFLVAAMLGWVPNQLVGQNGLFITNTAHNLVHLSTAIAFFVVARWGESASIRFMRIFGAVYVFTSVIGFISLGSEVDGKLLYFIHINRMDNYLHLGLGIIISVIGWVSRNPRLSVIRVSRA